MLPTLQPQHRNFDSSTTTLAFLKLRTSISLLFKLLLFYLIVVTMAIFCNCFLYFVRWAIIRDKDVHQRMEDYILAAEMGVSRDAQLRALKLLKAILAGGNGREIFDFGYKTMMDRWTRLNQIISLSKRFSLQETSPQYCNFLNKVRNPSPGNSHIMASPISESIFPNFH